MASLVLNLEVLGASDLESVLREMQEVSDRIGVNVCATFNDLRIMARPSGNLVAELGEILSAVGASSSQPGKNWVYFDGRAVAIGEGR